MGGSIEGKSGCWDFLVVENGTNVLGIGRETRQVDPTVVEIQDEQIG
jgi:hypothetical protein